MNARHWTRGAMLRHPLFWCMVPLIMGPAAFGTAFFFQQVHLAQVKGWAHLELVALFPAYTVASVAGMWVWGALLDRLGTARLIAWYQLPMAAGFVLIAASETPLAAAIGLALMGVTVGGNSTLPPSFWAEFFGTRHLGSIKAVAAAVMVLATALGPGISGLLIDAGITFDRQLYAIALWFVLSAGLATYAVGRARTALQPRPA